ncbi:phytanoyl-CoA dioxygenase family protein [Pleionea litopenaei]|uniref:Phytanoyl-CoA dioxygenase family protein n=1 Tax=Pleionea litopenaei TaxID=3070815 RepID=A0AA51RTG1_9GAMM|nr:phytanoyl-CoA dioxygenase family protein [Pleionea sp. HL-JVS1]WMS87312.1 phytanoyl-CoA dioxygenase family protein [Pleionea sp. HL-JVS1]
MREHIDAVRSKGYSIIRGALSFQEVASLNQSIDQYLQQYELGVVYEDEEPIDSNRTVRAIHGPHLYDQSFLNLTRKSEFKTLCQALVDEEVYVHQFKINMKQSGYGKRWPWHQDFIFWNKNDHIEHERLLNIAIILTKTSHEHGPLCVIPNSHRMGNLCKKIDSQSAGWGQDVSSNLTYQVDRHTVEPLIRDNGLEFIVGEPGDVFVFNPQIVHCSSDNISIADRRLLIITYNAINNAPTRPSSRPEFLCAKDVSSIFSTS